MSADIPSRTSGRLPLLDRDRDAPAVRLARATRASSKIFDRAILWAFVAGLAWCPFWFGSNVMLAWGINAVLFPGLVVIYELSLLVRGKHHPVAIRHIAVPAMLFAAVVLW